jgi:hypothetical protein
MHVYVAQSLQSDRPSRHFERALQAWRFCQNYMANTEASLALSATQPADSPEALASSVVAAMGDDDYDFKSTPPSAHQM